MKGAYACVTRGMHRPRDSEWGRWLAEVTVRREGEYSWKAQENSKRGNSLQRPFRQGFPSSAIGMCEADR